MAAVEISSLVFNYAGGFALRLGALSIADGEHALLAGPSGCGKSTLLHLIAGLEDAASGSIRVAGEEITRLRGAARDACRGRAIGMVFQIHHLLPGFTARENLLIAMQASAVPLAERAERAESLLERVGLAAADRGRVASQLSVGQQQRVAVARAVAARPAVVLADEPTASLDPDNATRAIALLRETCRESGAALLCSSHDPALRGAFDRVLDMPELNRAGASA